MGNKQGTLKNHISTAEKTGALAFPNKNLEEFPDGLLAVEGTLRNLDLSRNKISNLPVSIGRFKSLKTLQLKSNGLSRLPPEFGQLVKLETLMLGDNLLRDLPVSMANMRNLKEISLQGNSFTQFPMVLCQLKKLDVVDLSGNKITSVPDGVQDFQVTELNLNRNQISSISSDLASCPRLKTLRLEENCLESDALPVNILSASQVSTLCLSGNMISHEKLVEMAGYDKYMERYTAVRKKMD